MAKAIVFIVLLLISPAAHARRYDVGDKNGWTTNVDYTAWASDKNFTTGDTLVFTYGASHAVDVVLEDDYTNCTTRNVTSTLSPSPTTITLNAAGPWYFLCPTPGHCNFGQKLAINVTAGSTPPSSSPPPAGSSVPSTPADTPPAGGSVPSTPADTPPGMPPSTGAPTPPSTAANLDGGNSLMVGLMSLVLMAVVFV
ncbi:uclacyanin-3 [Phtheirospermum japonicum]|uniref:Uclacyanin-3 n=1 Tax=Phtheirospermum japonicum TaxID=374723 RepID=A0A830BX08_9LAMI|nr:uclacyanin-3 [Phtheirospermum japonicum]